MPRAVHTGPITIFVSKSPVLGFVIILLFCGFAGVVGIGAAKTPLSLYQ